MVSGSLLFGDFSRAETLRLWRRVLGLYEEGTVVTLIRGAATEAIAIACTKACDAARPDRFTIPTAAYLLGDEATFEIVAAGGQQSALRDFVRLADEIANVYAHGRLRDLRNYRLAHHIPGKLAEVDTAKISHLLDAMSDVLITISNLCAGAGTVTVSFDAVEKVWNKRCEAFWHRLNGGPHGRQVVRSEKQRL